MIKERPVLMCGDMVRAILGNRKTMTRRVVMPQPIFSGASGDSFEWRGGKALVKAGYGAPYVHSNWTAVERAMLKVSPYVEGQRLWVKETFYNDLPEEKDKEHVYYRADGECCEQIPECCCAEVGKPKWKPSIFMPRWASRIIMEITAVRVEWLQDISEEDCIAEGIRYTGDRIQDGKKTCGSVSVQGSYRALWDSINGRKHPWSSNPLVRVVLFKRL